MSIQYEILERRKVGTCSRQAEKAWKYGTLIWNSEERGTYVKKYHEHLLREEERTEKRDSDRSVRTGIAL